MQKRPPVSEVEVTVAAAVATVAMNRPEARNAMTVAMLDALLTNLELLAADDSVRVVILTGSGADFSVGANLSAMSAGAQPDGTLGAGLGDQRIWDSYRLPVVLHEMPKITIAAINGACAGAAMGLACACDLRWASDKAVFRTAFRRVGVAGDMSIGWTLNRIVGVARAAELLMLSERIDAHSAAEIGLVNRVVAAADFDRDVAAVADELAGSAPLALQAMKANFEDAERLSLRDYSDVESRRHMELLGSADVVEAAVAFMEKRPPIFRGL
jgi:2-(1,2-epoxy-1,2-dihydrophenyl)acetyl-CoA isomerase